MEIDDDFMIQSLNYSTKMAPMESTFGTMIFRVTSSAPSSMAMSSLKFLSVFWRKDTATSGSWASACW